MSISDSKRTWRCGGIIDRLREELAQMQLDANAVCQSLNIKWAQDGNYPEFAIRAIGRLRGKWARKEWERDEIQAELAEIRAELSAACAARDALSKALIGANELSTEWYDLIRKRDKELEQAHIDLKEVWAENARLAASYQDDADAVCGALGIEWTDENEYPTVALEVIARWCRDLGALRRANQALGKNRDYWYDKAVGAETERDKARKGAQDAKAERAQALNERDEAKNEAAFAKQAAQEQNDEVQELWLSPVEAEGLKRQLAKMQAQIAGIQDAVGWLWGYWDGNTLIAKSGHEEDIYEAWGKLLAAVDSADDTMLERLATLDAAEEALVECGIGGIFAGFDGLADAITQMAEHIKELTQEPVEVEITDAEMGEALQTEVRKRQEAERRAEKTKTRLGQGHHALTAAGIPQNYKSGERITIASRVVQLRKRAEDRECERDKWRMDWESATAETLNALQRTERVEALAQLVNEEVAGLLDRLGARAYTMADSKEKPTYQSVESDAWRSRELATQIREVLSDGE